jgi:DNA-binding response OmpR family regulator
MQALLFSHYPDEAAILRLIIQQAGFTTRSIRDIDQAIESWPENPSELIVFTLSEDFAVDLHRIIQMRSQTATTIVAIADMLSENKQIKLFESGADLVIIRPYSAHLLLAQIRATLRRTTGMPFFSLPTITQSGLVLDPASRTSAIQNKEPKHLTQLEFRLLYTLMTHAGQIIPIDTIVEYVWGYTGDGSRELVRGLVKRLRSKVEPQPKEPTFIRTAPGVGYFFNRFED